MTIASYARTFNQRLSNLEACSLNAPPETYMRAKDATNAIGDSVAGIIDAFRSRGFKPLTDDRLRNIEALLYGYMVESADTADHTALLTAEGFGEAMSGPAADRVRRQAECNRDALKAAGVI